MNGIKNMGLIARFDIGAEREKKGISDYNIGYNLYVQLHYILSKKSYWQHEANIIMTKIK